jgi:hypothetical protein
VDILGYTLELKLQPDYRSKNIKGPSRRRHPERRKRPNVVNLREPTRRSWKQSVSKPLITKPTKRVASMSLPPISKVEFYINNAVDYEEFNLFTLTLVEFESSTSVCPKKISWLTNHSA